MDSSQRKRLHVNPSLVPDSFLRKYAASAESTIGHTPPRLPSTRMSAASPHSPAVRAPSSLLSTRKILDRPHGPSSRLASSTIRQPPNLAAPITRSFFTSSTSNGSAAKFTFSPHVRVDAANQSFPPPTPGRSLRASTADMSGRGMAKVTGTSLFHMRIPEPDPELDGEALAKQVPDDPNRVGSIYADEYLAHLCPPELDDLQRRQFFCILDLRRLKYAANDVFAKKDWKINIMNFAKEYEKSRSLIMLRYGLYEFKTVPVSNEVMKKWKAENNIPEEKEEEEVGEEEADEAPTPRPNGTQGILARSSNKRRADDDLTKDSFMAASNASKRRAQDRGPLSESVNVATPAPAKNKRRAEVLDEADENQRNKMQKAPPSATKSLFESIANKKASFAPVDSTTPAKTPGKSLFESSPVKPAANPFASVQNGGSVFGGGFKAGAPGKNIFGHLSEESSAKGSGNEDADAEEETEVETEAEEDSEIQEVSQSDEASAAASGGAATPSQVSTGLFSVNKTGAPVASTTSFEAGEASKGPSLFDRITRDKNGEPLRATFGLNGDSGADKPASGFKRAASPVKDAPADKTWKVDTPIKFGGAGASSLFSGAATPSSGALFGSKPAATTSSLFQKASGSATTDTQDFASSSAKPADSNKSVFSSAATPLFGAEKKTSDGEKAGTTGNAFSAANSDSVPKPQPSTLFGSSTAATPAATGSLFGSNAAKPSSTLFGASTSQPAPAASQTSSLFGASTGQPTLFGAKSTPAPEKKEPATPEPAKPKGGGDAASVFGAPSGQNGAAKPLFTFGGPAPTPAPSLPPKTAAAAKGATDAASVFGAPPAGEKKFTFGGSAAGPASSTPAPLFGSSKPAATEAPKQSNLFGSSSAPGEASKPQTSLFGGNATPSQASKPQSTLFGSGAASSEAPKTPSTLFGSAARTEAPKPQSTLFGASSAAPSEAKPPTAGFNFGSGTTTSNVFGAGSNSTDNNASNNSGPGLFGAGGGGGGGGSFTFSAGGAGTSFNNPFATGTSSAPSSFNFGSDSAQNNQSSATPFAFGAGASNPSAPASTSSSFTFGSNTQQPAAAPVFGGANSNAGGSSLFSFSAGAPSGQPVFSQQPANAAQSMFGGHLGVPGGGSSTGTNTPFFGGASSLATTPANGTPEPEAKQEAKQQDESNQADEDGKPQEQISLTEGGPGEEDEDVVYEVRAKALKFVPEKPGSDTEDAKKDKKNPWKTQGVGPLRLLKHKTTGAVRILLRAEPRGHVAMNRGVLPNVEYKVENGGKYVKVMTGNDSGSGLETWMLQVKTNQAAQALAEALEKNKSANKK